MESRSSLLSHRTGERGRQSRTDARTVSIIRNEMLAAFNAADAFILAVVLVEGEFVYHPLCLRNPAPVFGPEPGFNEVSRAISAEAIKRAASRG